MARLTKAACRKRLKESMMKLNKVHQSFHLSPADNKAVYDMAMKLHKLTQKLK